MSYDHDWTKAVITNVKFGCPKCRGKDISFRNWTSSCGGFDDVHYRCDSSTCGHDWWVESSDA